MRSKGRRHHKNDIMALDSGQFLHSHGDFAHDCGQFISLPKSEAKVLTKIMGQRGDVLRVHQGEIGALTD